MTRGECSDLSEGMEQFKGIILVRGGIKIDLGAALTNLCVRPVNRLFNGPGDATVGRQGMGAGLGPHLEQPAAKVML